VLLKCGHTRNKNTPTNTTTQTKYFTLNAIISLLERKSESLATPGTLEEPPVPEFEDIDIEADVEAPITGSTTPAAISLDTPGICVSVMMWSNRQTQRHLREKQTSLYYWSA
jgi:hypothetical protein